jgi:dTDP-4-amino-4,6-dideoxygalactose transaminase
MIPISKPMIGEEDVSAVVDVLRSGMLVQGKKAQELERRFAEYCGVQHAVALNSGTAAIHAALYALGIKEGDEVITAPFTFVATANPVLMLGAKVVFADILPDTFNIDPAGIEKAITKRTKAIIPIDLFGLSADYTRIRRIAEEHRVSIVEDACQAHGAKFFGKTAGSLGHIGCFSFYATKNMMCGEGGMVTTDNPEYAELCKRFRHHGQSEQTRYEYYDIGYNYRIMDLTAALALAQFEKLPGFIAARQRNAGLYNEGLAGISGMTLPSAPAGYGHVYNQYTVLCDNKKVMRDKLAADLRERGIGTSIYYPKPLHLHRHFLKLGYKAGDFPVSEEFATRVLSLPVGPHVNEADMKTIISTIKQICGA